MLRITNILYYLCYRIVSYNYIKGGNIMTKIISRDSVMKANDNMQRRMSNNISTNSHTVSSRVSTSLGTKTITVSKSQVLASANKVMAKFSNKK